jgi:hypothetical protein
MAGAIEGIKAMNSVVRTLLVMAGVGVIGYGGYFGYNQYVLPASQAKEALEKLEKFERQNEELQKTVLMQSERLKELQQLNEKLQTSLKLIKLDRRMAHVKVLKQWETEEGKPRMEVEFVEMDRDGKPLGEPRKFELSGNRMYVECLLVKFQDRFIEDADMFRNATLCVFKGIYGDLDQPAGAQSLDQSMSNSAVPAGYADSEVNDFERQIWSDFWSIANNRDKQEKFGIRGAHGQANNIQVEQGKTYVIDLRASDGLTLRPIADGTAIQ